MNFDDYQPEPTCQIPGLAGIYAGVFGLKNNGTFVEIGAFDGKTYSNTYQLAKLGWRGIYVEPDPIPASACIYNHDLHLNVVVRPQFISNNRQTVTVYKSTDMTTGNQDFFNSFFKDNNYRSFTAEAISLDELLATENALQPIPDDFDLLVIDVEGNELQVLEGFSLLYEWMPKMIIIEAHAYSDNKRYNDDYLILHSKDIHVYMEERRYQRIYADTINSIYVPTLSEAI